MFSRLAFIASMTLTLAACEGTGLPGSGSQQEPAAQGHKGPPDVSPLEAPIETGGGKTPVATVNPETYNTAAFSARGNEPFWAVDAAGSTAIYRTPDNQKGRAVRVNRIVFAEGVEYIGVLGGRPFVLTVRGDDCRDDMSGQRFPMTAALTVSGRTNRGCAGPASAEVAQAVAAVKAPAPAAPKAARAAAPKPASTKPAPRPAAASATPAASEGTGEMPPAPDASAGSEAGGGTGSSGVPAPALRLPSTPPSVSGDASTDTPTR